MQYPNQPQQQQTFNLVLPQIMVKHISDALVQAPYFIAQPIIDEINRQIQPQLPARIMGMEMNQAPPENKGEQDAIGDPEHKQQ